jgi:hypothetical protein
MGDELKVKSCDGQVMLITVMSLSAITLAAMTISSLLTLIQLRQAQGISNSTKAVYAADAGIEYELYKVFKDPTFPTPNMTNDSSFTTSIDGVTKSIRSVGHAGSAVRAFRVSY